MLGVSTCPLYSDFNRNDWTQLSDSALLEPKLKWEQQCIEAPAVCVHNDSFFMFYGGAYNNSPQQIGCATSQDGICWQRLSNEPFLGNGKPGSWNSCESGHPFVFNDDDGKTYLFYQGNNDMGKTWWISYVEIKWENGIPNIVKNG